MRIGSAISVQRSGPSPVRPAQLRSLYTYAVSPIEAAATLPPPRRGDAAWLTLLMAQTLAEPRQPEPAMALAYAARPANDVARVIQVA